MTMHVLDVIFATLKSIVNDEIVDDIVMCGIAFNHRNSFQNSSVNCTAMNTMSFSFVIILTISELCNIEMEVFYTLARM